MGGRGSTRWKGHTPKKLAEETPCLDFLHPKWREALRHREATGSIRWSTRSGPLAEASVYLGPIEKDETRRLVMRCSEEPAEPKALVVLEPSQVGFSRRWYARYPGTCGKRARKLYLHLSSGTYAFLCVQCAGLTYAATQRTDKRVYECRRDPLSFLAGRSRLKGKYSTLVTLLIYERSAPLGMRWLDPGYSQ
jgi:hypothetical protein